MKPICSYIGCWNNADQKTGFCKTHRLPKPTSGLNARLYSALRRCADWNGNYFSQPKSMETLAALGYAEAFKVPGYTGFAFRITPSGRAKLTEMEESK